VRGILAEDYGVDLDKVEWITFEDRMWPNMSTEGDQARAARKELLQCCSTGARRRVVRQAVRSAAQAPHSDPEAPP